MKKLLVLLIGLMVLAACATTPKYQGVFLPKEYADQLEPGEKGTTGSLRWIRPGVDFAKYNKVMVDYVTFALAPDSDYKGINAEEMKELADAASLALVNAFKEKYPVVSEPGPDVLRFKFAIVDLKQSRPGMSVVSTVVPMGIGISLVKKGITGAWTGSGLTKAEALVIDSSTDQVVAAGYDDYSAKLTERYSKWGSVEDAFKHWGEIITQTLENLRAGAGKK
jgi:hypothetical protein